MSVSMVNMSTRLDSDLREVVLTLKDEGKMSSVLKLLLSAIMQDKVATLTFLLGLGDSSISKNKLQDNIIRANLFEKYLGLGISEPFDEWVSSLDSVKLDTFSGISVNKIDTADILREVLDDLGLELVEKGSVAKGTQSGSGLSDSATDDLVLKIRDAVLSALNSTDYTVSSTNLPVDKPLEVEEQEHVGENTTLTENVSEVAVTPVDDSSSIFSTVDGTDTITAPANSDTSATLDIMSGLL